MAFVKAIGPKPSGRHTVDRIKTDGHYSCGSCGQCVSHGWEMNCRWATAQVQSRNKRNNHTLTVNGETLPISAWAERTGLSKEAIRYRIARGMSHAAAVLTPLVDRNRTVIKGGQWSNRT
jgi:hypothetical protein